jgi:hypothetical protein
MYCRNGGNALDEAVASVLQQPECLELLVPHDGCSDASLQLLEELAASDPRLRLLSPSVSDPADALNQAFRAARGTLIGFLRAGDLYLPGAMARAVAALEAHPEWLMVMGESEEFSGASGMNQRKPTLPPAVGIDGYGSHSGLCQPAVFFRRSMGVLVGPFDPQWQTAFAVDAWLRASAAFPHRIGYIPHLQGCTRLHEAATSQERSRMELEGIALMARHFGVAPATRLHNLGLELQLGLAEPPAGQSAAQHLAELADQAAAWLEPDALAAFRREWMLDTATAPVLQAEEEAAAALQLTRHLPVRLLQALHPQLLLEAPGPPAGPHARLRQAVEKNLGEYPLLHGVIEGERPASPVALQAFVDRPFGVNLMGHAFEVFGIGEDIRMAARALEAAGVPCCVIHHPASNGAACSDRSLEPLLCSDPAGGAYAFNLVCMAAPIQARWLLQGGLDPLRERFTLTSWPWETQQWPKAWLPLLEVADELWPSSAFTAAALQEPAAAAAMHLQVMPMAAEVPDPDRFCCPSARQSTRAHHGLPQEAVLFGYGFDLNSTAIRKNPMAALEAFQLAFPLPHLPATFGRECNHHPLSEHVALLIKTFPPQGFSAEWHWLQARAAEDSRILLIAESFPCNELLALYGCCDVFLSLHRSEGFGRGMAEALQLGVDVIATDFGGNTDFCTGPLAHPVRWRPAPIPRGAYPCADGHGWAEPDLEHAAELCRAVAARRLAIAADPHAADPSRDAAVLASYRERFSFATVGGLYRARLEELWADREGAGERLRWRGDRSPAGW